MTSRRRRELLPLLAGLLAIAPLVLVDPAALVLLADLELVGLLGTAALTLLREDARTLLRTMSTSVPVVQFAAGVRQTRLEPRSLLSA